MGEARSPIQTSLGRASLPSAVPQTFNRCLPTQEQLVRFRKLRDGRHPVGNAIRVQFRSVLVLPRGRAAFAFRQEAHDLFRRVSSEDGQRVNQGLSQRSRGGDLHNREQKYAGHSDKRADPSPMDLSDSTHAGPPIAAST